ncbi:disulfide bond formation protein B [Seohaeicola zhoushanensis]|uniref:Dihydroneopterin aldolase n=1 Tax=Seohaeicola zhoushanensis TaxID=1569283 RepID=A0A8J3GZ20_9RHOB|nr:disulfide bond formation protein B [Seohaeicola zhoushanensis]GHF59187.1 dihydroneopterin aldolase [Seohaeicola zhoushanensis]
MTRLRLILLAAGGSAALLLGAFTFQYFGYPPCKLCLWQRWPHAVAILLGLLAVAFPGIAPIALLGAIAALTTGGIGVYHTGVERGWWEGPNTCTSGSIGGLSSSELLDKIMNAPLIRCDDVAWQLMGLSMASWNALISFGLAAIWVVAWRARA